MKCKKYFMVLVISILLVSVISSVVVAENGEVDFVFGSLSVDDENITAGDVVEFTIGVTNTGNESGNVITEFYVNDDFAGYSSEVLEANESIDLSVNYTFEDDGSYDVLVTDDEGNEIDSLSVLVGDEEDDDTTDFQFFVESVSEGEVINVDRDVNRVNYSGTELIFMIDFGNSVNIRGHSFSRSDLVDSDNYYSTEDLSEYHYLISFDDNGEYTMRIEYYNYAESTVRFVISDADVQVVDSDKHEMYRNHYYVNMRNLNEIEEIMGVKYSDDVDGVIGAYSDVIADSRALRSGPVRTAERLYAAGIFMGMSPYVILIVLMLFGFVSIKYRTLAEPVRSLMKDDSKGVRQEEMMVVERLKRAKKRGDQTRIEVLSEYKNVPNVVSSKIKDDIPNIGRLRWVLGETKIDDNVFKGELKDLIFKWIKDYVKIADRDKGKDYMDKGVDPKIAFPEAIRSYVNFIVHEVGYHQYSDYLDHYDVVRETIEDEIDDEFDDDFREIANPNSPDIDWEGMDDDNDYGGL